jgi:hypothetical protein
VQFVKTPDVGVPNNGVTKVGLVVKEIAPDPFTLAANAVATPVPYPVVPAIGNPVQFVKTPDVGVPNNGVTKVGLVVKEIAPDPFTLAANAVATPVPYPVVPAIGSPVQFVNVPLVGVPRIGVTKVGLIVPAYDPVPEAPDKTTLT